MLIGPVRSGRVAFEDIRRLYPGAFLLTHSASYQVREQLHNRINVPSDNPQDVNSAGLTLPEVETVLQPGGDPGAYSGLVFDWSIPPGGAPADTLDIFYNVYNQVEWTYAPGAGTYLRFQNTVEDTQTLVPSRERLDGSQLGFENVLVLFAGHRFVNPEGTILEIELLYVPRRFGLLLRDGRVYEVSWSTPGGRLEVRSAEGDYLALKPGRTFFEVVSFQSGWDPAARRVRFYSPLPPTPTATPTRTPTPSPTSSATATP